MFDLTKEIAQWRTALSEKQMCDNSNLDELESHLRDEIDQLKLRGLSEQEAFFVSTHRLGDTDALANEFAKVNESLYLRKKLFFAGCGVFAYIAATFVAQAFSNVLVLLAIALGLRGFAAASFGAIAWIGIFSLIIFACYTIARKKDPDGSRFSRMADSAKGKAILLTIAFVMMIAWVAAGLFVPMAIIQMVGAKGYGQIIMPTAVMRGAYMIVPVIVMMMLIYLRPSRHIKVA